MWKGEDAVRVVAERLETCRIDAHKIALLKSFQTLVTTREKKTDVVVGSKRDLNQPLKFLNYLNILIVSSWLYKFSSKWFLPRSKLTVVMGILSVVLGFVFYYELYTLRGFARFWLHWENIDLHAEQCTVDMPSSIQDTFRPPVDCSMCRNVTEVHRVRNISPQDFESRYAYNGRPVVVEDGQRNWSASDVFSFSFFKSIYSKDSPVLFNVDRECQFFPYQTSFKNLKEVFNMSREKAERLDGTPWYIGWSNCDSSAANVIREHYSRPYFLPDMSEESKTDWIFMGTPGHGAQLHIDHVGNPSWQAQIRGRKRWTLEPPPECYFDCVALQVTVNTGEIIVLDTNIWYHGTFILGGDISITIGSEFD